MKLIDLETLLLLHGLHRCKLSWAVDHWAVTVRDSADMEFQGRVFGYITYRMLAEDMDDVARICQEVGQ